MTKKVYQVKTDNKNFADAEMLFCKGVNKKDARHLIRTFNYRASEADFDSWAAKVLSGEIDLTQYYSIGKIYADRLTEALQQAGYQPAINANEISWMDFEYNA